MGITPDAVDAPPDAGCTGGKTLCGTTCVDLNTSTHCGSCANDCTTTSKTCSTDGTSSICCAAGETNCGGVCVSLSVNADTHCGSCGNNCTTQSKTCSTDGTSSICCPAGQTNCNGVCVNTSIDEGNCGACASAGTTHVCSGATNTCCGGTCIDPTSNDMNCNGCNTEGGVDCSTMGATPNCQAPTTGTVPVCCANGDQNCNGTCVTPGAPSDTNCGGCNTACTGTTHCQTSDSVVGNTLKCCENSENNCNGTCSDPMSDENNCGGCDPGDGSKQCKGSDTCQQGVCCGPGEVNCGGVCVDPKTDPAHCGVTAGCTGGTSCSGVGSTPVCSDGTCQATCDVGETQCPPSGAGPYACVITNEDPNHCGNCTTQCAANQVCSAGTCITTCPGGTMNCNGACVDVTTDPNNCGACAGAGGATCSQNDICTSSTCCPSGYVVNGVDPSNAPLCCPAGWMNCSGVCKDPLDAATCGSCNMNCSGGTCTTGTGGTFCCGVGLSRCGSSCVNETTSDTNCGDCGITCTSPDHCGQSSPVGSPACCDPTLENNCGGTCVSKNSDTSCGTCGNNCTTTGGHCDQGSCCASGETNYVVGGNHKCCAAGRVSCDGLTCIDLGNAATCGTTCANKQDCTTHTDGTTLCLGGVCSLACPGSAPTNCFGSCTDTRTDPDNCGQQGGMSTSNACGNVCATGATCSGGTCQACPTGPAAGCGGVCVNTLNDPSNCGACGVTCSGTSPQCTPGVTKGHCCPAGQAWCGTDASGGCKDLTSDEANCGGCAGTAGAEVCTGTASCQNGDCKCGFNQALCNGTCVTEAIDPLNCGGCTVSGGPSFACPVSKPYCVSNSCVATCPAPLTACGTGASAICSNLQSDSNNCGGCGAAFKCPTGQGCVSGSCKPIYGYPVPVPAKCLDGGGPPLVVPGGPGGSNVCTGELGAVSFTFGICSRTNIGPLSAALFTDAFNSTTAAYHATCTPANQLTDCGVASACVGDPANGIPYSCVGGGVGVNGTADPIAETSKAFTVGGAFWAFGTIGLASKGDVTVKQSTFIKDGFTVSGNDRFFGPEHIRGRHGSGAGTDPQVFAISGAGKARMDSTLFTAALPCDATQGPLGNPPLNITASPKCTTEDFYALTVPGTTPPQPLGEPCGTAADLIPVKNIVEYFRNPIHNDNQAINLPYNALANPATDTRLELPCGYYYLDSLGGSNKVTIVVKGRTALFIGGSADIHVEMIFDVQPNASLDMFVGGVVSIAHVITLGSPAYPRLTRMYIGSARSDVSGSTCTSVSSCSSGLCSACPAPSNTTWTGYGACSGTGTCGGSGANLDQAIDMSQGGNFNGLLWAGFGPFSSSNNVEMYGSIFANYLDFSGALTVHYDIGARSLQQECGTPVTGGSCESCRDCANNPCIGNVCSATCTSDLQCCPGLQCIGSKCQ